MLGDVVGVALKKTPPSSICVCRADKFCAQVLKLEEDETFDDLVGELEILQVCHSPFVVKYFGAYKSGQELFVSC
jgi:hypothetical protein